MQAASCLVNREKTAASGARGQQIASAMRVFIGASRFHADAFPLAQLELCGEVSAYFFSRICS
jgi:hypothetical protein